MIPTYRVAGRCSLSRILKSMPRAERSRGVSTSEARQKDMCRHPSEDHTRGQDTVKYYTSHKKTVRKAGQRESFVTYKTTENPLDQVPERVLQRTPISETAAASRPSASPPLPPPPKTNSLPPAAVRPWLMRGLGGVPLLRAAALALDHLAPSHSSRSWRKPAGRPQGHARSQAAEARV